MKHRSIQVLHSDWQASKKMLTYFGEAAKPAHSCIDPIQSLLTQNWFMSSEVAISRRKKKNASTFCGS